MRAKKRLLGTVFALLMLLVTSFACVLTTACKEDPVEEPPEPGITETAEFYYDYSDTAEYRLSLLNGTFTFTTSQTQTGTYTVDGTVYTFTFSDGSGMTAELGDNIMVVTYNGSEMRFWKEVGFTVTFETNGGSAVQPLTVINGKTFARPEDPTKSEYGFIGWYSDSAFTKSYVFGTEVVTQDITLYARWGQSAENEFEVAFDLNYDGAEALDSQMTVGGKLYSDNVTTPERSGYRFLGWWVSMYGEEDKVAYSWTEDMVFSENMTLFAQWESTTTSSSKLNSPVVEVSESELSWEAVTGASSYQIVISGPDPVGTELVNEPVGGTSFSYDFAAKAAGDYVISVTAESSSAAVEASDATLRYYKNKALARVSLFETEGTILNFNSVENATEYLITVECGNENHQHEMLSLGSATSYDFSNCTMCEGGIRFVVTAQGEGFASSTSAVYVVEKTLDGVSGFVLEDTTELLSWDAVDGAANYTVTITANGTETSFTTKETSVDLRTYGGKITVSVVANAKGYNASAAAVYTYEKSRVATPDGVSVIGTTLSWNAVDGATGYTVKIGTETFPVTGTQFDMSDAVNWITANDYTLSVQASGAVDSLWSDEYDVRYFALYSQLTYGENAVSWRYVVGATAYEVVVNRGTEYAGETIVVEDGSNRAEVKLTKAGENTISVRFYDGSEWSDWAQTSVFAYTLTFDSRSGAGVAAQYLAEGDRIVYPTTTREGYTFGNWSNAPGVNAGVYDEVFFEAGADVTVYASWVANDYTVTLIYEDGTTAQVTVTYGEAFEWDTPMSSDPTYGFAGWYSGEGGSGFQFTDGTGVGLNAWSVARDVSAYTYYAAVLKYTVSASGDVTVLKGSGISSVTVVTIPSTYTDEEGVTRNVTIIGSSSFSSCTKMIEINIPNTVTSITTSTFRTCTALERINVYEVEGVVEPLYWSEDGVLFYENPLTVSEGYGIELAFYPRAKADTSYTIPDGIQAIEYYSLYYAPLKELNVPASVNFIYSQAIYYCSRLEVVNFLEGEKPAEGEPSPYSLTVSSRAFYNCAALEKVNFPSHMTEFAFTINRSSTTGLLSSIYTPFSSCSKLKEINVAEGGSVYASLDGMLTNADKTEIIYVVPGLVGGDFAVPSGVFSIADFAFYGHTQITSVTIPGTVESVGEYAFSGCTALTTLTIDGSLSGLEIGDYAFRNCTNLKTVDLKAGGSAGIQFGESVFYGCSTLTTVNVAADVEAFNGSVFGGCSSLQTINVDPANPNFKTEDGVLYNAAQTTIVFFPYAKGGDFVVPDTVESIDANTFYERAALQSITIGKNVKFIGTYAFYYCDSLETVTFVEGNQLEEIGMYAFYRCEELASIEFPATLKSIGAYAFQYCYSLTSLYIPNQVESIGTYAFNNCTALESVIFEDGTVPLRFEHLTTSTYIDSSYTFAGSTKITEFILPERLTNIPSYLLGSGSTSTPKITELVIPSTVTEISTAAFRYMESLRTVIFAEGGTEDLIINDPTSSTYSMFSGCSVLESVVFPARLVKVPDYCFYNVSSLKSVTFGAGESRTADLGESSFYGTSIETFVMPAALKGFGENAFYNCTSLRSVTLSDELPADADFSAIFKGCVALEEILTSDNSKNYSSVAGILYDKNQTAILYLPVALADPQIVIPKTVKTITDNAFNGLANITSILFEEGSVLETIGANAFSGTSITSLVLPAGVSSVDVTAFYQCDSLTSVTISDNFPTSLDLSLYFAYCPALEEIVVPANCAAYVSENGVVYSADKTRLEFYPAGKPGTEFAVPATVTTIGLGAFGNNSMLEKVIVPAGVTTIRAAAFAGMTALKAVEFAEAQTVLTIEAGSETGGVLTPGAFYGSAQLESVNLSVRQVAEIGAYTFYGTEKLTSIELPDSVGAIGSYAFAYSGLKSIAIPTNVKAIAESAFYGTEGIAAVYITDIEDWGNISFANEYSNPLYNSASLYLNNVLVTTLSLPAGMTSISDYAFFGAAGITNLIISNSIENIGNYAFCSNDSLRTVIFGSGVKYVGSYAFADCPSLRSADMSMAEQIKTFTQQDGTETGYLFAQDSSLTSIVLPKNLTKIARYMFTYCTGLQSYVIPEGIEVIGERAFYECSALEEVTFPSTLQEIECAAFYSCYALKKADLSQTSLSKLGAREYEVSGGTEVRAYTFTNCTSLEEVLLPGTLKEIGPYMFFQCTMLKAIDVAEGVTAVGAAAFYKCESLEEIVFPSTLKTLGNFAFGYDYGLKRADLSKTQLTEFEYDEDVGYSHTFYYCEALEEVLLPETLTNIGEDTFYYCLALKTINIPKAVITIDSYAFYHCESLESIELPDALETIGTYAFAYCTALSDVDFGGVRTIGNHAFRYCGFTTLTLPSSLEQLGTYVFGNNTELVSVDMSATKLKYMAGTSRTTGAYTFYSCTALKEVKLPSTLQAINPNSFGSSGAATSCVSLETIEIPSSVTYIGGSAFRYSGLKSITLPSSVGELGTYAFAYCYDLESADLSASSLAYMTGTSQSTSSYTFYYCEGLKEVKLPSNLQAVNGYSFRYCTSLESIDLPASITYLGTYAFANSGLREITLPPSATIGSTYVFAYCESLEKADLSQTSMTYLASTATRSSYLFAYSSALKEVKLPSTLTTINGYAFRGTGFTSFTFPSSITTVGTYAFADCEKLESVDLSQSKLTRLGGTSDTATSYMFYNCTALKSVILPSTLKVVNGYALNGCSSLTSISLPSGVTRFGNYAFAYSGLGTIEIPAGVTDKTFGNGTFMGCPSLTSFTVAAGNTSFLAVGGVLYSDQGSTLFLYPSGSTGSVVVPASVSEVANYAFAGSFVEEVIFEGADTVIGTYAFDGCAELSSVRLPLNLPKIDTYTFRDCISLDTLEIPEGVETIGNYAFRGSGLKSIVLPASVIAIGTYVFADCESLESVDLSLTKLENLGTSNLSGSSTSITTTYTFRGCSALSEVKLPQTLTAINPYAFGSSSTTYPGLTSLESIEIPESVTSIGSGAFRYSGLKNVVIPANVTTIGTNAFANCASLENFTLAQGETPLSLTASSSTSTIFYQSGIQNADLSGRPIESIGYLFYGCASLATVKLPSELTSFGTYTFYNCSSLQTVEIPASLAEDGIGSYTVFSGTSSLTEFTVDPANPNYTAVDGVLYKDNGKTLCVYPDGKQDESFTIPDTVTEINTYAFDYAVYLRSVTFPSSLTAIPNYMFYYASSLCEVNLPQNLKTIGNNAFYYCANITSIILPKTLESIGSSAFYNCYKLVEVVNLSAIDIEQGATSNGYVGNYARNIYNSLDYESELIVDGDFVTYKEGADTVLLAYLGKESDVVIPSGVTKIADYAFYAYAGSTASTFFSINLKSIVIPEGVTTIGERAFYYCSSLEKVVLPSTLTTIETYAFYHCEALKSIELPAGLTTIGNYGFAYAGLVSVELPDALTSLGTNAFYHCDWLTDVEINGGLEVIGNYAFSYAAIETIVIPEGVKTLNDRVFYYCEALKSVVLPKSLESIGTYVFNNCDSLEAIYYCGASWANVEVGTSNTSLDEATVYVYSETAPGTAGDYWHYVNGVPTPWTTE